MEASVATPQAPPEPEVSHDGLSEASRSTEELFQWSGYVHVGQGAEECEHGSDGQCQDRAHFHAWVCLPNVMQARDIGEKAKAAKARRIRALRDPTTDAYAVLEAELDEVTRHQYDELVRSIAERRVQQLLPEFMRELGEDERFEHYPQDNEEFQRLRLLDEEDRDEEEYERLQAVMLEYGDELQRKVDERIEIELTAARELPREKVIEEERDSRIEAIATEQYLWTWYVWARYICSREPTTEGFPSKRKFGKPEDLHSAPPEVVDAIREKIRELEARTVVRGDAAGNS